MIVDGGWIIRTERKKFQAKLAPGLYVLESLSSLKKVLVLLVKARVRFGESSDRGPLVN